MARKQTDKKLICFTQLALLDRLIKDDAEIENRSESAIIENHLLSIYLPQNKDARFWVENFLYSENGGIGQTLNAVFNSNAAGVGWAARYDNLFPLVEFARNQEVLCRPALTGQEHELHHCISQIELISSEFRQLMETAEDLNEKMYYKKEIEFAEHLMLELRETPQFFRMCNVYQLLMNNWHVLMNLSITYRLLSDLVLMEKGWKNTSESRSELREILKQVSQKWAEK